MDLAKFNALPRNEDGKPLAEFILNDKKLTAPKEIGIELNKILDKENRDNFNYQKIGSYGGFDLVMKSDVMITENGFDIYNNKIYVEGNLKYSYNNGNLAKDPLRAFEYPANALNRIDGLIQSFEKKNKDAGEKIEALQNLDLKFLNKDKLESSIAQLAVVNARINKTIGKENAMQQTEPENGIKRRF